MADTTEPTKKRRATRKTTAETSPKIRVHALAKELGKTSKEIIEVLAGMDLKKVAQSTLSAEEVEKVKAALEPEEKEDDKIRTRVRKNVANEISQIEEKVEADLAELLQEQPEEDLLEDVTPEITPKPTEESAVEQFVPLFMAPGAEEEEEEDEEPAASRRRRRGRRGAGRGRGVDKQDEPTDTEPAEEEEEDLPEEPVALKGSTRLESQRRRRAEMREEGRRKKHIVSQAEFLARRESVERTMVVRERARHDHPGMVTQVGVLEDDLLVEHFVTSEAQASMIGNIYLGRVQNVLPSMEAAFIDIGKGRNGVLYAGEVDWKSAGLGGRGRKIEQALKSGDQVLVQVSKDPVGHKGARLTTQISLAGRYLVYVPGGRSAGISRKLPGPERKRLKEILEKVVPGQGGAIIRTAAENVSEDAIAADVDRLHRLWEDIQTRADKEINSRGSKPVTMYEEPDMLVKVVRDLFNEDFTALVVDGDRAWNTVHAYVKSVAPDLLDRVQKYQRSEHQGLDAFAEHRVDEQLQKALNRKVWLPSGGSLVIDRTEAMTVVDVNTGKFTGSGGNLEETVTRNNLEAAEEIVRQMRLRDLGGMIVVDFIDMVLPENQELVLRRLKEALGRDRTRHQVSEVTSLGLVQMTRKRLGTGLLETFSTECEHCAGRGLILHEDPVEEPVEIPEKPRKKPQEHPAARAMKREEEPADIEELAASVVVTDDSDDSASRRRRSRRGTSRGREAVTDVTEIEEIVSAALDHAGEEDPDEPTGADYVPEKSFQQAVEEFDASPRRRRRTRGNSRSDRRPQREDFPGDVPSGEDTMIKVSERPEPEQEQEEAGRRRRRRVSRSRAPEKAEEKTEEKEQTPTVTRSRGRRRAVRRTTPTTTAQPERKAEPEARDVEKQPSRSRGRRRVARRTSSR
ncbi:MAG: translation initiation factor IF-2 N-terminal domain-containing protein [Corynebacterium sp.]|uniref:translation initiation factor IF-2 N-terminal domain-containing protein n=1 Tax=Corynebacterium sp. TaxID=1720 RepID=UPI0026E0E22F|nr:translation initiation factor IF-2 N-terminal domain-containing protein [Corynebacterium sp.]MDO5670667.1 translation initiation factor IF-2 N-terminal domain-containing protein [Corynebacterium sp.]